MLLAEHAVIAGMAVKPAASIVDAISLPVSWKLIYKTSISELFTVSKQSRIVTSASDPTPALVPGPVELQTRLSSSLGHRSTPPPQDKEHQWLSLIDHIPSPNSLDKRSLQEKKKLVGTLEEYLELGEGTKLGVEATELEI